MKVIIGGDFVSTFRGSDSIKQETAFSKEIIDIFRFADYSIVNLESPLRGESYACNKSGQALEIIPEAIPYLKNSGIDAVTLANNHFKDQGRIGIERTISALKDSNMEYVGGGTSKEEIYNPLIINDKVEIVNYCESEFSVSETSGSNALSPIKAYYDIQEAKKNNRFIIVIVHGGREKYNLPTPRMQELYRFMIDAGANVVVNHHQHCYSGYEKYNDGLIFYGLGNLFFDKNGSKKFQSYGYNEGFLLELNISEDKLSDYLLHPYTQGLKENISVTLMNQQDKKTFEQTIEKLNKIIMDSETLAKHNEEWCKLHERDMLVSFEPFSNKYLKALYRRGYLPSFITRSKKLSFLNLLRCETHNDQRITSLINNLKLR